MSDRKSIDPRLPVLDPQPMEEAFGAIDQMALDTYRLFLSTTEPLLSQIGKHLVEGNFEAAADMAHAAKGAARMTGAARLAAVCSEIESCSKDEDLISALEWLALVPTAFDDVSRAIAAVIEAKS